MILVARPASFLQTLRARLENHGQTPPGRSFCKSLQVHPLPTGKHTRSSAPAQNCIQAHQLVSAPVQVHPLRTVSRPINWQAHPFKCTRSELYPSPPTGKRTRSSAPAQKCIQAHQLVSTPVQVHAQNCIQAHQLVSAPLQARPLSTVSKPTNW